MTSYFYIVDPAGSEPRGPYTAAQIAGLHMTAKLGEGALVARRGEQQWYALAQAMPIILKLAEDEAASCPQELPASESLRNCSDCSHSISVRATACPKCGAPQGSAEIERRSIGTPVTTIQETSKQLKAQILYAVLFLLVGWWLVGDGKGAIMNLLAVICLVVGLALYVSAKIRIWWHHK